MHTTLKSLSLIAILSLGTGAFAQETTPTTEAPAADAAAAPAADATAAPAADATAAPAEAPPVTKETAQPGQPYPNGQNGDWREICIKTEDGNDPCQMYQLLLDADQNAVAEIALIPLPAGGQAVAGVSIVAPLETLLSEPMTVSIDGGEPKRYGYTVCSSRPLSPLLSSGCLARIGLTADDLALYMAGNQAKLVLSPAANPEAKVELTISLSGFTASYNALPAN